MRVHALSLVDFRSYERLEVAFGPGPQVVVGPNATGKTNLIEALVVVSRGASHRARADSELVRWGAPAARVEATVSREPASNALQRLGVALAAPGSGVRAQKRIRVNGIGRRADALSGILRTVLFSPESMALVSGAPALRRDELDTLAAELVPGHGRSLATYGRALIQRNSLLRLIRDGEAARDQLRYWDALLIEEGGAILEGRLGVLVELGDPLAVAHREIAPGEARLTLRYESNAAGGPGEGPREALRRRLRETAEKELWNGQTLVGPHRDDMRFLLGDRDLAAFGSRGQQRSAILALKLAEVDLLGSRDGVPPLLLLDDVFSELDPDRRAHLVRRIRALPQAFVSTTSLEDLDPVLVSESTAWQVAPGSLERIS
ncbi:MAG: DNA replication/repair protein RecF [Candidatus Limnocylindrales bacterium]